MFVNYVMHNDNYKLQRDLMDNHIIVFNNVLEKETCENIIEKFESLKDEHENFPENKPFFTQINFSKSDNWTNESHILLNLFTEYLEKYMPKPDADPHSFSTEPGNFNTIANSNRLLDSELNESGSTDEMI